jgi:hypothetical protein
MTLAAEKSAVCKRSKKKYEQQEPQEPQNKEPNLKTSTGSQNKINKSPNHEMLS